MLNTKDAMATIAVRDLPAARRFYEGTLGFAPLEAGEDGTVVYKSGDARLLVYQSQFAGTNRATAASWNVGADLEALVRELAGKGVAFEHYDGMGRREGDIHVTDGVRVAWFKDPDGNILSIFRG